MGGRGWLGGVERGGGGEEGRLEGPGQIEVLLMLVRAAGGKQK